MKLNFSNFPKILKNHQNFKNVKTYSFQAASKVKKLSGIDI